jgi:hypothetical protein
MGTDNKADTEKQGAQQALLAVHPVVFNVSTASRFQRD